MLKTYSTLTAAVNHYATKWECTPIGSVQERLQELLTGRKYRPVKETNQFLAALIVLSFVVFAVVGLFS